MTHMDTTPTPLDRANALISLLIGALENIRRSDNISYAHGAADFAIEMADKARTPNSDGYLVIR